MTCIRTPKFPPWRKRRVLEQPRVRSEFQASPMAQTVKPVQLKPQTLEAFDAYIREAETAAEQSLRSGGPFLWSDLKDERTQQIRAGQVVAQFWAGRGPVKVPHGLIHDWVSAASIPGATLEST